MMRTLFQAIFGSFFRKAAQDTKRAEESAMIKRMIEQANAIADGTYITSSNLPPPVVPERRKQSRTIEIDMNNIQPTTEKIWETIRENARKGSRT